MKKPSNQSFFMKMSGSGDSFTGRVWGASGRGNFSFEASGSSFNEVVSKLGDLFPDEFYDSGPGAISTGDGEEPGTESNSVKPGLNN